MKDYCNEMNLKNDWKLKDLPYKRPDFESMKKQLEKLCIRVKNAESYDDVRKCISEYSDMLCEIDYASALTYIDVMVTVQMSFMQRNCQVLLQKMRCLTGQYLDMLY